MQRWKLLEDSIFEQRCELAQVRCDIFRDGSHNSSYREADCEGFRRIRGSVSRTRNSREILLEGAGRENLRKAQLSRYPNDLEYTIRAWSRWCPLRGQPRNSSGPAIQTKGRRAEY